MALTEEQLLGQLNQDLAREYAGLIQYVRHASVMGGVEDEPMIQEQLLPVSEEMGSAISVSERIDILGKVLADDADKIETSRGGTEMLKKDLAGEFHAVSPYKLPIHEAHRCTTMA
jgi:bacterioferritin (cytochrome b1)